MKPATEKKHTHTHTKKHKKTHPQKQQQQLDIRSEAGIELDLLWLVVTEVTSVTTWIVIIDDYFCNPDSCGWQK